MANLPDWKSISVHKITYRDHQIVVKQDFGSQFFLIDGMPCMWGYVVVVKDVGNVMPGATWFQTVHAAMDAIDVLCASADSDAFWRNLRRLRNQQKHAAELAVRLKAMVGDIPPADTETGQCFCCGELPPVFSTEVTHKPDCDWVLAKALIAKIEEK